MPIRKSPARSHPLEVKVRKTVQEYDMITPGECVIVAVSGGADSTALLLCLNKLSPDFGITLAVAHLNHRIRGAEGDADEGFVRQMAAEMKLPFVSEAIEVKKRAEETGQNIEELGRRLRYDFLQRAAQRLGAQKIAVGHNRNDQAETALYRLIRGSGFEGLSGIHPVVDGLVIRPLLECSRQSILEYLKQQKTPYKEDSSNKDLRYARNRIRRELLPYLENNFNPRIAAALAQEALLAREAWSFIHSQAEDCFDQLNHPIENGISLQIKGLVDLHPALQREVLRLALRRCLGSLRGIGYVHIQSVLDLCKGKQSGGRIQLPRGSLAIRQSDILLLLKESPPLSPSFSYELGVPGSGSVAEDGSVFQCTIGDAPDRDTMKHRRFTQAFLEPAAVPRSLTIRSRKPGDRYGGSGHRKVKKMLINSKIPRAERAVLPMVAAGDDIIWIPGFRPARGYEAKPESPNCIIIKRIKDSG